MKRVCVALLIVCLVACGGGGSDPVTPPKNTTTPPKIESGSFAVTATMVLDGCNQSTIWDGVYDVVIDSTNTFTMGPWTGTWNPNTISGSGETEHVKRTTRYCTVSTWTAVYITFENKDRFYGTVIYRLRLSGDCNDRSPCSTNWRISGVRQ